MTDTMDPATFAKECLKPFAPNVIGKLPRVTCPTCSDRDKNCTQHAKGRCAECFQYISTAHIHIDFVGHAPLTARLLELDPLWAWEPMAYDPDGSPLIKTRGKQSTMWIKLTIQGITRPGVGIAPSSKEELEKELIGDALRNAAMRFGLALDLWAKGDLIGEYGEPVSTKADQGETPPASEPAPAAARQAPPAKKAATAPRKATTAPPAKKAATPPPAKKAATTGPTRPAPAPAAEEQGLDDPVKLFAKIPKPKRQEAMAALADSPIESDEGMIALWPFPSDKTRGDDGEPISAETLEFARGEAVDALRAWAAEAGIEL